MKKILGIVVLSFLWLNTVLALPNCIGDNSYKWTMCESKKIFSYGEYFGEFKDGKMHGQGTLSYLDGEKYVGEFKDNNLNGQGTFTYLDGSEYIGGWINDKRDGYGTFTYSDGSKYIGEWMNSERHGYGTLLKKNGTKKKVGEFQNGKFIDYKYDQ